MDYNKVIFGLLFALATCIIGYGIISLVFDGMVSTGIMEEAYGEAYDHRQRTIWLISICSNIVGIQIFRKRKTQNLQRGVAIFTVLAAAIWVFYYKDSLFFVDN